MHISQYKYILGSVLLKIVLNVINSSVVEDIEEATTELTNLKRSTYLDERIGDFTTKALQLLKIINA